MKGRVLLLGILLCVLQLLGLLSPVGQSKETRNTPENSDLDKRELVPHQSELVLATREVIPEARQTQAVLLQGSSILSSVVHLPLILNSRVASTCTPAQTPAASGTPTATATPTATLEPLRISFSSARVDYCYVAGSLIGYRATIRVRAHGSSGNAEFAALILASAGERITKSFYLQSGGTYTLTVTGDLTDKRDLSGCEYTLAILSSSYGMDELFFTLPPSSCLQPATVSELRIEGLSPVPIPTPVSTPTSWETLVSTDFEGISLYPWVAYEKSGWLPHSGYWGGRYRWRKRSCRAYEGSYSAWAVGGGSSGEFLACGQDYPSNADSWLVYGPFSLVNATAAELRLKVWLNSEVNADELYVCASTDGSNYYCVVYSGDSNGWMDITLDLSNVPRRGSLLGRSKVWVAIGFDSNSSIVYPEGAYVDNIILRKCPQGASCLSNSLLTTLPGGRW